MNVERVQTMGRIQSYQSVKPKEQEIKPFIDAIKEATADLDWALRCYSLTLRDLGLNEQQIVAKMREVFQEIMEEVVKP